MFPLIFYKPYYFLTKHFSRIIIILVGMYVGIHVARLTFCADSWIQTVAVDLDDHHFLNNLRLMFDQLMDFRIKGFFYSAYAWGYGTLYWLTAFLVGLPWMLLNNQFLLILSERLLSFLPSLGSIYILWSLLSRELRINKAVIFFAAMVVFLKDIFIFHHSLIHPEGLYIFLIIAAFYCLYRDRGNFSLFYIISAVLFGLALSTKLMALPAGIIFIIYLWHYRQQVHLRNIFYGIGAGLIVIGFFNWPLIYPLIRAHFFKWVFKAGTDRFGYGYSLSFWNNLLCQVRELINIYPGFLWCLLSTLFYKVIGVLHPNKNNSNDGCNDYLLRNLALGIVGSYAFFLIFILGSVFFVYGYITYYFLFFLLALILNKIFQEQMILKYKILLGGGIFLLSIISSGIGGIKALTCPWSIVVNGVFYKDPLNFSEVAQSVVFLDSASRFLAKNELLDKVVYVSPLAGIEAPLFRKRVCFFSPANPEDKVLMEAEVICFRTVGKDGVKGIYGDFFPPKEIEKAFWLPYFKKIFDDQTFKVYVRKTK